jgi:hypothetical protein
LYFANYAIVINIAEREALNGAGRDLRQRRLAYYGNAEPDEVLRITAEVFGRHDQRGAVAVRCRVTPRRGRSADLSVGGDPAAEAGAVTGARVARQVVVAVLCLAALDRLIPGWLASAEARRYESETGRASNSRTSSRSVLSSAICASIRGPSPRIAFLGDSIVWGYGVPAEDTIAARFQARVPEEHVLNLGMNNTDNGRHVSDREERPRSVATLYVFDRRPRIRHPQLPQLIPVAQDDLTRFGLTPPDTRERQRGALVLASVPRLVPDSGRRPRHLHRGLHLLAAGHRRHGTARTAGHRRPRRARRPDGHRCRQPDRGGAAFGGTRGASVAGTCAPLGLRANGARPPSDGGVRGDGHQRGTLAADERADLNAQFGPEVRFVLVDVPPGPDD